MRRLADTLRSARGDEQGIALAMAIMLLVLVSLMMAAAGLAITTATRNNVARNQRVTDTPIADMAIQRYTYGLRSREITATNNYVLGLSQMQQLAATGDQEWKDTDPRIPAADQTVYGVYQNSSATSLSLEEPMPPDTSGNGAQYTMVEPVAADPTMADMWQVLRIDLPDYGQPDANLVVYFRTWSQAIGGGSATTAQVLRAEFQSGGFGEYQLLADGPIQLGGGLTLDGPVHTNGYQDDPLDPPDPTAPNIVIAPAHSVNPSQISCQPGTIFSTATGDIDSRFPASCKTTPQTGQYISFMSAEDSFTELLGACGSTQDPLVYCFPYTGTTHKVKLESTTACVTWTAGNGRSASPSPPNNCYAIANSSSSGAALMFHDNVSLSQDGSQPLFQGRLTIATHLPMDSELTQPVMPFPYDTREALQPPGAANIYLDSSIRINTGNLGAALGLMAQGDVIYDQTLGTPCPATEIDAAIVAETGRLTIPPQYTVFGYPTGADVPTCSQTLVFKGSIAGHFAPADTWYNGAGYPYRNFSYDQRYKNQSPPFFPLTDNWQLSDWRDADLDCFQSTGGGIPTSLQGSCR